MNLEQAKDAGEGRTAKLRRIQAVLVVPAIALIWIPGTALYYAVFFILLLSLILELVIQSSIRQDPPDAPDKPKPRRRT